MNSVSPAGGGVGGGSPPAARAISAKGKENEVGALAGAVAVAERDCCCCANCARSEMRAVRSERAGTVRKAYIFSRNRSIWK
jgi:hypothetical protein